eukprot:scaffold107958_cov42-Prasinocladus_malaysianus.AAC.1
MQVVNIVMIAKPCSAKEQRKNANCSNIPRGAIVVNGASNINNPPPLVLCRGHLGPDLIAPREALLQLGSAHPGLPGGPVQRPPLKDISYSVKHQTAKDKAIA